QRPRQSLESVAPARLSHRHHVIEHQVAIVVVAVGEVEAVAFVLLEQFRHGRLRKCYSFNVSFTVAGKRHMPSLSLQAMMRTLTSSGLVSPAARTSVALISTVSS